MLLPRLDLRHDGGARRRARRRRVRPRFRPGRHGAPLAALRQLPGLRLRLLRPRHRTAARVPGRGRRVHRPRRRPGPRRHAGHPRLEPLRHQGQLEADGREQRRRLPHPLHAPELLRLHGRRRRERGAGRRRPPGVRPFPRQRTRRHGERRRVRAARRHVASLLRRGGPRRDAGHQGRAHRPPRPRQGPADVREDPQPVDIPQPGHQRHHGRHHPGVPAHRPRRHGRDGVATGPRRGGRRAAAPPPRFLPDLPGTGRVRHAGRRRSRRVVPAGIPLGRRRMVGSLPGNAPRAAGQRRAADAQLLAALAVARRGDPAASSSTNGD